MQLFSILRNNSFIKLIVAGFMLAGLNIPGLSAAQISGVWKDYPAANLGTGFVGSQIDRIISTEKHTYVVPRGRMFNRLNAGNTFPHNLELNYLFRFDNDNLERGIYAVCDDVALSGARLDEVAYSHRARRLVAIWSNMLVDIISDDDTVVTSDALAKLNFPGSKDVRSINFDVDGRHAYLALTGGYLTIDLLTGDYVDFKRSATQIDFINRFGSRMAAVAVASDGVSRIFVFDPATGLDTDASKASKVKFVVGHTGSCLDTATSQFNSPQCLLPLTDDTFAVLVSMGVTVYCVNAVKIAEDGSLSAVNVFQQSYNGGNLGCSTSYYHKYVFDAMIGEWRDGYIFNAGNSLGLLRSGLTFDAAADKPVDDFRARAAVQLNKTNLASASDAVSQESQRKLASWDGERFYFFHQGTGIYSRDVSRADASVWNSATTWSERTATMPILANANGIPNTIDYNPEYGILVRGNECNYNTGWVSTQYDNLAAFKDGKWKVWDLWNTHSQYLTGLGGTRGAVSDPLNPRHIYSSSYYYGLCRQNLEDPTDLVVFGSYDKTDLKSLPGFIPIVNASSRVNFAAPTFDVDNVMWTCFDFVPSGDSYMRLFYWTPERRLAAAGAAGDHQAYLDNPMEELVIPGYKSQRNLYLKALSTPGHTTKLAYWFASNYSTDALPLLIDHKGTLSDPSDDRIIELTNLKVADTYEPMRDEHNWIFNSIVEDPVARRLYLMTLLGVYYLELDDLDNPAIDTPMLHLMKIKGDDGTEKPALFEVSCASIDDKHRMWVGSYNGVSCISLDDFTVLGKFDMTNSLLPSNQVIKTFVSPLDQSVWVATAEGLLRFFPEGSTAVESISALPIALPSEVTPDYNGHVTFSGLSDAMEYSVVNGAGEEIARLGSPLQGRIQWNCRSEGNVKVPTGEYFLATSGNTLCSVKVMN